MTNEHMAPEFKMGRGYIDGSIGGVAYRDGWFDAVAALVEAQQPAPSVAADVPQTGHLWLRRHVRDSQPSPTPQADSAQDEPLQAFDSPRAKALMRAWEEGWAACRDAEYVGEEAQNDAFNSSHTLTLCIAEDQQLPAPQADSQPAPDCDLSATTDEDLMVIAVVGLNSARFRLNKGDCAGALEVVNKARDACIVAGERASARAARAPADSVLEDAARLWNEFIEAWRKEVGVDKIVNIMGGADKLKAVFLDAARKQHKIQKD